MFERFGHYKVLDRIGTGGIGDVYRARDTRLGRTVAITVPRQSVASDPDRRAQFLQDARASAALSHPNIAALFEVGGDHEPPFLVFEFVPGQTLAAEIAGQPMNTRRALDVAAQVADGLADAHAQGILHRDLRPDNIILTPKGQAKILDFGLATWTVREGNTENAAAVRETGTGTTVRTVAYMSPEQALGEQPDHRTDIYALGAVLFEMLTGKLPFSGATSTALALQIAQAQPPAVSSVNVAVPRTLDQIVTKALAKNVDRRYDSAATLAAELRQASIGLEPQSDGAVRAPVGDAGSRPWIRFKWVAAALLAASMGAAWLVYDQPAFVTARRTLAHAYSAVRRKIAVLLDAGAPHQR
jgi:serine/threonine protein kinase